VGLDGTPASVRAAEWAAAVAEATGKSVDLVTAWAASSRMSVAPMAMGPAVDGMSVLVADEQLAAARSTEARATADRVARIVGARRGAVPLRTWALHGPPAEVLVDLAGPGDLLVVGPTGHRAVVGAPGVRRVETDLHRPVPGRRRPDVRGRLRSLARAGRRGSGAPRPLRWWSRGDADRRRTKP
jgi:hypothetical protein